MGAPLGNLFALGLDNSGAPPVFESPEDLKDKCIDYFQHCITNKQKINITGLALFLGFQSRQSIYDYEKKEEFSYIIKRAKLTVENAYETNGTTFDMFALKNMGWSDKSEMDLNNNHSGEIKITRVIKK